MHMQANSIFISTSQTRSVEVEKCRKRKSTDNAKENKRELKKRASQESLQVYSRHDGGRNADDVNSDLPPEYLKDLMTAFL